MAELHSTSDTAYTHTVARMELNPLGSDGGCTAAAAAVERSREVLAVLEDDESM